MMRLRPRSVGLGLLGGLLAIGGCSSASSKVNLTSFSSSPCRIEIYERGRPVAMHSVAPGSAEEQAIFRWLAEHDSGWHLDLNSYVPARRIKSESFDLNYHRNGLCVLNYDASGRGDWRQVSRTLASTDGPPLEFEGGR